MALPQDGQDANGLTKVTQIPAGKELMFIDPTTNEGGIITLEDLTKQILNGLTSQTFGLDSGTQTLPAAINYLYGNFGHFSGLHYYKIDQINGITQTFTFSNFENGRTPFIYVHGSQLSTEYTVAIGTIDIQEEIQKINFITKLHGNAKITFENLTITSESENGWSTGFVIY